MLPEIVIVTTEQRRRSKDFAQKSAASSTSYYRSRGQHDEGKIEHDIYIGKVGEYGVFNYIKSLSLPCSAPSRLLYGSSKKDFSSDLVASGYHLHVKSYDLSLRQDDSWLFQKEDPLVKRPYEYDVLFLCAVDDEGVYMRKRVKAKEAVGKYKEPRIERLRPTKLALYLSDL